MSSSDEFDLAEYFFEKNQYEGLHYFLTEVVGLDDTDENGIPYWLPEYASSNEYYPDENYSDESHSGRDRGRGRGVRRRRRKLKHFTFHRQYEPSPIYVERSQLEKNTPEYTIEEDLEFMIYEETTGNWGENYLPRRELLNEIYGLAESDEALVQYLSRLPENDCTIKLEILSPFKTSAKEMVDSLRDFSFKQIDECMAKLPGIVTSLEELERENRKDAVSKNKEKSLKSKISRLRKDRSTCLATATLYALLANGRIIGRMLYLPGAKLDSVVELTRMALVKDRPVVSTVKPSWIKHRLIEIAAKEKLVENDELDVNFRLKSKPQQTGRVLWVKVASESTLRQWRFEKYFLRPEDRVIYWREIDSKKDTRGGFCAECMLCLGLSQDPPRHASQKLPRMKATDLFNATRDQAVLRIFHNMLKSGSEPESLQAVESEKNEIEKMKERFYNPTINTLPNVTCSLMFHRSPKSSQSVRAGS